MLNLADQADLGDTIRRAREAAGISRAKLAKLAGVKPRTLFNVEHGKHKATGDTLRRLLAVQSLGLTEPRPEQRPSSTFCPSYAPVRSVEEMMTFFQGRGGTLDQSWLYLEVQAALDFLRYVGDAGYITNYRDRVPLGAIASAVVEAVRPHPLDVVALGSGDGRTETRLVSHLCQLLGSVVNLDLLDCSHALLMTAFRNASEALAGLGVKVHPIHGDFYGLTGYEVLTFRVDSDRRRRLWAMLGHTVGNLRDELAFFRDLASISRPGDCLVVDFQIAPAPADDEAAIRANDRLLTSPLPKLLKEWLSGPLRRNLGLSEIPYMWPALVKSQVPGSYAIQISATVRKGARSQDYHLARIKRYDPNLFAAALSVTGWDTIALLQYGPAPGSGAIVAQRR